MGAIANFWPLLTAMGLITDPAACALGCAAAAGIVAGLTAQAVGTRQPVRPVLQAVVALTLFAPPAAAPPWWPALLAAAVLLWLAPTARPLAANDNRLPPRHPFAVAV